MGKEIRLTPSEWDIMRIIWEKQPCNLRTITAEAGKHHTWTRHAVVSFLKKMEAKGAIHVEDADPFKLYSAAVEQDDAITQELGSTLTHVFGDSPVKMVSYLSKAGGITRDDIAQMIAILQDGDDGGE